MTTSPGTAAAIRAEAARKVYGTGETAVVALDNVTLSIPGRQSIAVTGPYRPGKSTLMHRLARLDSLIAGQVLAGDVELGGRPVSAG